MIMREELKEKLFSTNEFDENKVKSSIARKNIFNLRNKLKTIKQIIALY